MKSLICMNNKCSNIFFNTNLCDTLKRNIPGFIYIKLFIKAKQCLVTNYFLLRKIISFHVL